MKKTAQVSTLLVFTVLQGCNHAHSVKPEYRQPVDLTGEWAVEWEDKKSEYKETIYIWISQHKDHLTGSALDPNLIPAEVAGRMGSGEVTFDVKPESGRGFHAPTPQSPHSRAQ